MPVTRGSTRPGARRRAVVITSYSIHYTKLYELRVTLEHLERCRCRRGPTGREVLVGVRPAELVDQLHVLGDLVRIAVEELVLIV